MKKIKDMTISELENNLQIWLILKKFYFFVGLIFVISIGIKFIFIDTNPYDLVFFVIALHILYIPIIIEISIKRKLEEKRINMYVKRTNISSKK